MAGSLDALLLPEVAALIADVGKSITFHVTVGAVYSASTSALTSPGTTTDYAILCSPPASYSLRYVDGDLVRQGDVRTLIPAQDATGVALPFTPVRNMTATFDSKTFTVLTVAPIYSGVLVCAYSCQLRQGP